MKKFTDEEWSNGCVGCGEVTTTYCESCEHPICPECDSHKFDDVAECKDEQACSSRIEAKEAKSHTILSGNLKRVTKAMEENNG